MSEAFALIMQLATSLGVSGINRLDGCWEHAIDGNWRVAVNGHGEPVKCSTGAEVPAFTAYVEWNGWPAGIISPRGGEIVAGSAANEDTLIAALQKALDGKAAE